MRMETIASVSCSLPDMFVTPRSSRLAFVSPHYLLKKRRDRNSLFRLRSRAQASPSADAIEDLWKDRRVVVGFTRHFGCVLCMKRADLLASCKDELDKASVSLIIIGPGKVEQAKTFAANRNFPGEIYADPDAASHKVFEFVSGVGSTFSMKSGMRVISAYLEGYRQNWDLSFDEDTRTKGGW
ncbi:hypothetical protein KP509_12G094200 [Ceratopteris richardii]|uniref:Thioredoxin-like protein AAED1, chloroplastic n=1 Tax=Ceratopteris richardii TaxID=49495 RepID=A0A8T2TLG5_CERRI|nr:hypothetical protein KP509_12G094200 [Ceratopteris richardii]